MTDDAQAFRRDVLLAPLLAALPLTLGGTLAKAGKLDPTQTIIRLPNQIDWNSQAGFPPQSVDMAPLWGTTTQPGLYLTLVRWHPGYMSAPHTYETDRLCVVVSGTWWVNSGADFDPASTVPVPAGSFVHRVARTPHYDGVRADGREPAVIAISGMAPVGQKWLDPATPGWRKV
ncbi:MAG: cupin domain-containing protein [Acidisphaera sp.]|nr:cupin domain-containing protein [Acidisphaera sp.]